MATSFNRSILPPLTDFHCLLCNPAPSTTSRSLPGGRTTTGSRSSGAARATSPTGPAPGSGRGVEAEEEDKCAGWSSIYDTPPSLHIQLSEFTLSVGLM